MIAEYSSALPKIDWGAVNAEYESDLASKWKGKTTPVPSTLTVCNTSAVLN